MTQTALEPITGRYAGVPVMGEHCRIYFEEAGQGIPLLCLHTAGADSRQFRHLMCDEAVTRDYRVIAFDMPWHGKSYPPAGWQEYEYRLTTERYVATIRAFCAALALERPVALGCSIGGRIVLQLAHAHGAQFRALIGLEAADHQQPWYDTSWLHRGDVHGGEVCAALVSGLIAPQSPAQYRHETLWNTCKAAPGCSRATSTSTGSMRICAANWAASTLHAARYICSPESTISPVHPRIRCAPRARSPARR
jgi:pimeloyl-ACP methyl ester carboxylesterase